MDRVYIGRIACMLFSGCRYLGRRQCGRAAYKGVYVDTDDVKLHVNNGSLI